MGDHLHSWAFDGLRTKKWNVSCEGYGRRWRVGDTVGALLDTDLMEMRFYLNGRDLGAAFVNFLLLDIAPALRWGGAASFFLSLSIDLLSFVSLYPPASIPLVYCLPLSLNPPSIFYWIYLTSHLNPAPLPLPKLYYTPSLNVRQTVRVNFGQYRFTHPPSEVRFRACRCAFIRFLCSCCYITCSYQPLPSHPILHSTHLIFPPISHLIPPPI